MFASEASASNLTVWEDSAGISKNDRPAYLELYQKTFKSSILKF